MVALNHIEAVLERIGRIDHLKLACQVNHEGEWLKVKDILVVQFTHLFQISEELVFLSEAPVELKVVSC